MKIPLSAGVLEKELLSAWRHVQAKVSAPGLDGIDIADFEADADRQLKKLTDALLSGAYTPLPVRIFTIHKEEKVRELGILTVRDRIAQHALAQVLTGMYEPMFSPASFAFRRGKSAKKAVEQVCVWIQQGKQAVFRSDITDYFNRINHTLLLSRLSNDCDDAFLHLLWDSIRLPEVRDGTPVPRTVGLCQGSPLSPVLSNLFLHSFDLIMGAHSRAYLRYCDDFLCLEERAEDAQALKQIVQDALTPLCLELKPEKTFIGNVADGFSFLGYVFSDKGSIAAVQAVESLEDRLIPCLQRLQEAFMRNIRDKQPDPMPDVREPADILRGWLQYYALPPAACQRAVFAAAALTLAARDMDQTAAGIIRQEWLDDWLESPYWPLIAELCIRLGQPLAAVRLYEMWFGWDGPEERPSGDLESLYPLWRTYYATMCHDWLIELTQIYTDSGIYAFANTLYQQSVQAYDQDTEPETQEDGIQTEQKESKAESGPEQPESAGPLPATPDVAKRFMELFIDEKRYYGHEEIRIGQDRTVKHVAQPLSLEMIQAHLRGECAISTSFADDGNKVTCIALDVDILGKWLSDPNADLPAKKQEALLAANALAKQAKRLGLRMLLEDSGQRGFHLWIPIEGAVTVAEAAEITLLLVAGQPDLTQKGIGVERFPGVKRIRSGVTPKLLRLPCGRHPLNGTWCPLIEDDGTPVRHPVALLQSFQPTTARCIQDVLRQSKAMLPLPVRQETAETDVAELIPLDESIEHVLRGCAVIRSLCAQAHSTGFLRHDERMHLLYVFGHMGEIGRQYLHQVMKWTYNYRYEITQRFFERILDRPISCNRLREAYADRPFVADCVCDFPMVKGTYPSPVLHAMKRETNRHITLPRQQHVQDEVPMGAEKIFQTHDQLLELANQMLTLNKEKNRLEEDIEGCQQKLSVLFDRLRIDSFEIGIGTLVRERQQAGGYKWRVDIL